MMVEVLKFLLLGFLQGITEPLPISSSGHLVILQAVLNLPTVDYFLEIILHFASLLAILVLFRKKISDLIIGNYRYLIKKDIAYKDTFHYVLLIIIGVIPAGIMGLLFKEFFEQFLNLLAVGISLIVTGFFLMRVQKPSTENTQTELKPLDALTIGAVQIAALLPGISRSGSTYIGGLMRKIKFDTVVEFSFMLYIPISIGAMVFEAFQVDTVSNYAPIPLAVSFIVSGITTYFAFKWFVNAVKQGNLKYFAYYCFFVGVVVSTAWFIL